jgi:hypothetical protein
MPFQNDSNIASCKEKVHAIPPISFDDLAPFDYLEELENEIMKYMRFPIHPMALYDPIEANKQH